jgi:hypothetical protein
LAAVIRFYVKLDLLPLDLRKNILAIKDVTIYEDVTEGILVAILESKSGYKL